MSLGPHAHQIYLPAIFFLSGYLKSKVFVRKPRTVDDLKVSIRGEIATVPQEMLINVMQNMFYFPASALIITLCNNNVIIILKMTLETSKPPRKHRTPKRVATTIEPITTYQIHHHAPPRGCTQRTAYVNSVF